MVMEEHVEVEYVPEKAELNGEFDEEFKKVFEKFTFTPKIAASELEIIKDDDEAEATNKNKQAKFSDSDVEEQDQDVQEKEKGGISNRKRKIQRRMKIAELKKISSRPDVVEVWDANAADPKLLVYLKSYRNTVPVPSHWSQKRNFLQGKRGIEKPPFELPEFIAATGIQEFRQAYVEKEKNKRLKQKQRDRMQPKMGKMNIDYEVLYDAFLKYNSQAIKPSLKLTSHGDLYYEGKEFEVKFKGAKPGNLSQKLKEALGMEEGDLPPWVSRMQTYGPPPSYPFLKIPCLNAPIDPEPPVEKIEHWGYLVEEEEEEEEEVVMEEQVKEEELEDDIQSVDSLSSTPTGVETPDVIDLRKQQKKEPEKPAYQVLEVKEEKIAPGTLLGTTHTYVIDRAHEDKAATKRVDLLRGQKTDGVDVSLQPEELELMDNVLPAKYKEAREEKKLHSQGEDFSDMVAENAKKRKRKMQEKEGKSKKKEFKF